MLGFSQNTSAIQSFCQEFVRNILFTVGYCRYCVESPPRMTQEVDAADNEIDSDSEQSPAKLATETAALHDTASPARKTRRPPPSQKNLFALDQKQKDILNRYKDASHQPPTFRGTPRGTPGEHISLDEYYQNYYHEISSSITFTINGVPQSFKQQSILEAPFFDLPTYTATDTSTCPDHSSTATSGK